MKQIKLLLLAAPSGAGKNSFLARALKDIPQLKDIVTYTTRHKRQDEVDGVDYNFVDETQFRSMIEADDFAEWAQVHDNLYGTTHKTLVECWEQGRVGIMDVDIQGVRHFKSIYPDSVSLFLLPPSIGELRRRILAREKVPPENLELRLANAEKEMAEAETFDLQFVNDDFEQSYGEFKKRVEELLRLGIG